MAGNKTRKGKFIPEPVEERKESSFHIPIDDEVGSKTEAPPPINNNGTKSPYFTSILPRVAPVLFPLKRPNEEVNKVPPANPEGSTNAAPAQATPEKKKSKVDSPSSPNPPSEALIPSWEQFGLVDDVKIDDSSNSQESSIPSRGPPISIVQLVTNYDPTKPDKMPQEGTQLVVFAAEFQWKVATNSSFWSVMFYDCSSVIRGLVRQGNDGFLQMNKHLEHKWVILKLLKPTALVFWEPQGGLGQGYWAHYPHRSALQIQAEFIEIKALSSLPDDSQARQLSCAYIPLEVLPKLPAATFVPGILVRVDLNPQLSLFTTRGFRVTGSHSPLSLPLMLKQPGNIISKLKDRKSHSTQWYLFLNLVIRKGQVAGRDFYLSFEETSEFQELSTSAAFEAIRVQQFAYQATRPETNNTINNN